MINRKEMSAIDPVKISDWISFFLIFMVAPAYSFTVFCSDSRKMYLTFDCLSASSTASTVLVGHLFVCLDDELLVGVLRHLGGGEGDDLLVVLTGSDISSPVETRIVNGAVCRPAGRSRSRPPFPEP